MKCKINGQNFREPRERDFTFDSLSCLAQKSKEMPQQVVKKLGPKPKTILANLIKKDVMLILK